VVSNRWVLRGKSDRSACCHDAYAAPVKAARHAASAAPSRANLSAPRDERVARGQGLPQTGRSGGWHGAPSSVSEAMPPPTAGSHRVPPVLPPRSAGPCGQHVAGVQERCTPSIAAAHCAPWSARGMSSSAVKGPPVARHLYRSKVGDWPKKKAKKGGPFVNCDRISGARPWSALARPAGSAHILYLSGRGPAWRQW